MARKSYRRHSRRHTRGGSAPNPSSYSSGSSYGMAVNGPVDSQIPKCRYPRESTYERWQKKKNE